MRGVVVPAWLERLLETSFFNVCRTHADAARSECNMYCLDCSNVNAFCFYCRSSRHKDHRVIQIRRSSYHDVVRVSEIEKVLDTSGVQTYVINSARVLFLNERPQPKPAGKLALPSNNNSHHVCHICGRTLLDTFRFCSLGCKVVGIKGNVLEASFTLDSKNDEVVRRRQQRVSNNNNIMMSSSSTTRGEEEEDDDDDDEKEEMCEGSQQQQQDIPPPPPPPPLRRRKGIPQRAPFRS